MAAVSSWCHHGVSCCCRVAPFIWLPCRPVGDMDVAPVSRCEKRMRTGIGSYLNKHDGDDASSPSGRHGMSVDMQGHRRQPLGC